MSFSPPGPHAHTPLSLRRAVRLVPESLLPAAENRPLYWGTEGGLPSGPPPSQACADYYTVCIYVFLSEVWGTPGAIRRNWHNMWKQEISFFINDDVMIRDCDCVDLKLAAKTSSEKGHIYDTVTGSEWHNHNTNNNVFLSSYVVVSHFADCTAMQSYYLLFINT